MPATLESLEQRLTDLEQLVAAMRQEPGKATPMKDWRRTLGMFAGDDAMKEINRLGKEIRDAEGPEDEE